LGWTDIRFVNFDIPDARGAETLPSLGNGAVTVPEPRPPALFAVGLAGLGFGSRKYRTRRTRN